MTLELEIQMDPRIRDALAQDRVIDITTTGHKSGAPRRIEIWFFRSGGRIYLTKDALTRPEHYRAMEPRLAAWQEVRAKWDPEHRLASALSRRLLGDDG